MRRRALLPPGQWRGLQVYTLTPAGSNSSDTAGTPAGTNSTPTMSGTSAAISAGTPAGTLDSVSAGTPSGTVSQPTFTGNSTDNRSAFVKVIFCRKN